MKTPRRAAFILAAILIANVLIAGAQPAAALDPWLVDLSASSPYNGGTGFHFSDGRVIVPTSCVGTQCTVYSVRELQWAPDGSEAVFLDANEAVQGVHYVGATVTQIVPGDPTVVRRHPTFVATGDPSAQPQNISTNVVWAEKKKDGSAPSQLMMGPSSYGRGVQKLTPDDGLNYSYPNAGPNGRFVYEVYVAGPDSTPSIGIYKGFGAETFHTIIYDGRMPAYNGNEVAFVRLTDGYDQIWTVDVDGSNLRQRTFDAHVHDYPAWANFNTITYRTNGGVGAVQDTTIIGFVGNVSGIPAYQTKLDNAALRLAGGDRFATTNIVSNSYWATASHNADFRSFAKAVVLARSDTFADALGGAALAAAKEGPLLLTSPTTLTPATATEIQRVLAAGAKIYILGSTGAISSTVENQVQALGYQTVRLAGADRFATSLAIADAISANPATVLAATGMNFPDALAAGAAAGSRSRPGSAGSEAVVVLTNDGVLPASTKAYLDAHSGAKLVPIGKQAVAATSGYANIAAKLSGADRYATADLVARTFFGNTYYAGVATGANWPDALSGGALMGTLNGPMLLTAGMASELSQPTAAYLAGYSGFVNRTILFGSTGVVTAGQQQQICTLIAAPSICHIQGPTGFIKDQG